MADQTKSLVPKQGAGFRPGAILGAVLLSAALILVFDLLSHAHL